MEITTTIQKNGKIKFKLYSNKILIGQLICCDYFEPAFYINHIDVKERFRNVGFGTILINRAIEYSIKNGCTAVSLIVEITNIEAIRLYKKLGFFICLTTKYKGYTNKYYTMTKQNIL